ncbi:MAG: PDZ domain-containing protein [Fuerstiella sp.]
MTTLKFHLIVASLLWGPFLSVAAAADASEQPATGLQTLVAELSARDFATRLQASTQLADLSLAELRSLLSLPESQLNAEVVVRLLKELERRYDPGRKDELQAVSDLVESLTGSTRLLLADGSQRILARHWRTRVMIARQELESLGARFRDGSFTARGGMGWMAGSDYPSVQLLIGEDYTGGSEGLRIVKRMQNLTDPGLRGNSGLFVWILDGHPLTDQDQAFLAELVGPTRVNERSRVALGIRTDRTVAPGVVIDEITSGSSAEDAKLVPGDVLLAILDPIPEDISDEEKLELERKQQLRDFDDLVARLRNYREGDVIRVRVRRGGIRQNNRLFGGPLPQQNPPFRAPWEEIVEVTLKGWDQLPVVPN